MRQQILLNAGDDSQSSQYIVDMKLGIEITNTGYRLHGYKSVSTHKHARLQLVYRRLQTQVIGSTSGMPACWLTWLPLPLLKQLTIF